jgi:1-acyl-sn-glycerol-3-phosphate acyltransferase
MRYFLSIPRFLIFLLLATLFMILWSLMDLLRVPEKITFRTFRFSALLVKTLLNIKTKVIGEPPRDTAVIISNHRSYIDVIMMPSKNPYVVLAKKQVRAWPVIGRAASAIGTLFVERDSRESRAKTREKIRKKLEDGVSVLIYPEGTTFEGPGILSFKPGMFHTCAKGGFPIIPVAVEYEDKSMAWIGDDTFVPHFLRAFGKWRVRLTISIGPMMKDTDGESFRQKVHAWIDEETQRLDKIA